MLLKERYKGWEEKEEKCKQLVDDLKENGRYWNLKEVAIGHILWSTHFGIGCGPVTRQTM